MAILIIYFAAFHVQVHHVDKVDSCETRNNHYLLIELVLDIFLPEVVHEIPDEPGVIESLVIVLLTVVEIGNKLVLDQFLNTYDVHFGWDRLLFFYLIPIENCHVSFLVCFLFIWKPAFPSARFL